MKHGFVAITIFILALVIRVSALGGFVTIDEPRWLDRSRWFLSGLLYADQTCPPVEWGREFETSGWGCTFQIGYPGVTTMWGGSLGLWLHYWQTADQTGLDFQTFLETLPLYPAIDPEIITPMRLPFAVAGALFVPVFYLLLRRFFTDQIALAAALLVMLQPFHIGLSRIIHHDGLNTMFMVLSLLALIGYWLRGWPWYWLLFSAVLGGLALLSKQVSWFMVPYVAALGGLTLYYRWRVQQAQTWAVVGYIVGTGAAWAAGAGATFVAFFPAMWVIPGEVIGSIFEASLKLAEAGQPHYFLGGLTKDPGWLFYPLGWLLRATPLEVVGLLGVLAAGGWRLWAGPARPRLLLKQRPVEIALALFVGLLLIFVTVSDKKLVRYFLPAFPIIDVFIAMGLFWLGKSLAGLRYNVLPLVVTGLILLVQGGAALAHYPYYFTYYTPLVGGPRGAAHWVTIEGWGEGLNEAAAYLNQKPEAANLKVVVEMWCSTFSPFFAGTVNCLNSSVGGILQADYLVYYYNLTQRRLEWMEQWDYFRTHYQPEHRVTLHGLDYALIYRNPIQHQVDRQANGLPQRFTAFGYNLAADGRLTLFWQNLGLSEEALALGVAASKGAYTSEASIANPAAERKWLPCEPEPAFVNETNTPKAIIESLCPLSRANLPPGLYDLQLGLRQGAAITPLRFSLLGVFLITPDRRYIPIELKPGVSSATLPRIE